MTNAIEAGTCHQGRQWLGVGWALERGGEGASHPFQCVPGEGGAKGGGGAAVVGRAVTGGGESGWKAISGRYNPVGGGGGVEGGQTWWAGPTATWNRGGTPPSRFKRTWVVCLGAYQFRTFPLHYRGPCWGLPGIVSQTHRGTTCTPPPSPRESNWRFLQAPGIPTAR